ncbi:hypothetical protein CCACVL1_00255, partial [Corchorus capsularis]
GYLTVTKSNHIYNVENNFTE